jgi:hypothetical protein
MTVNANPNTGTNHSFFENNPVGRGMAAVGEEARAAAGWVAGKFNAAVENVRTTDSTAMKIVKSIAFAISALVGLGFLLAVAAPIAYFCSPALIGVFIGVLAIGTVLTTAMGIKAVVFAAAAYRSNQAENATPPDQQATDGASPTSDTTLVQSASTQPVTTDESQTNIETHTSGKIMTFFAEHWKAILTVALIVLSVAMCVASGGIGFSFIFTLVTLAGLSGIGVEKCVVMIGDKLADMREVSKQTEAELETFKQSDEYTSINTHEKKAALKAKGKEIKAEVKEKVAKARVESNQIEHIKLRHGVSEADAKKILELENARTDELTKVIKETNDRLGISMNRALLDEEFKKVGKGDFHERLGKLMGDGKLSLEEAKKTLFDEDAQQVNDFANKICKERDKKELPGIIKEYGLDDVAPDGRRNFIAKQILIERDRRQNWLTEQNMELAKARGGDFGCWSMGVISLGPNRAAQIVADGGYENDSAYLNAYKDQLIEKFGAGGDSLSDAEITGIQKNLRKADDALITADKKAHAKASAHKTGLKAKVDTINDEYGVHIDSSKAHKAIENKKGVYHDRWEKALGENSGDATVAQASLDAQDVEILKSLAEKARSKTDVSRLANIKHNYSLDGDNADNLAKEISKEIDRHQMWIKQQVRTTGLSSSEIESAIKGEDTKFSHVQVFKERVEKLMTATPPLTLAAASKKASTELRTEWQTKIDEAVQQCKTPDSPKS